MPGFFFFLCRGDYDDRGARRKEQKRAGAARQASHVADLFRRSHLYRLSGSRPVFRREGSLFRGVISGLAGRWGAGRQVCPARKDSGARRAAREPQVSCRERPWRGPC